jgi:hypothetical protein
VKTIEALRAGPDRRQEENVETRAATLQEMEEMAAEMLATARKLPPSQERHDIIKEIGQIRARIDGLKAKGKT